MSKKPTADEKPKKQVAKRVITPKRRYFFPSLSRSVEAASVDKALAQVKNVKQAKEGDA